MTWLPRLRGGLDALLHGRRMERELDDELRAYLDALTEENRRAGMTPGEAERSARVAMGSLETVKEDTRDVGWETRLEGAWRDVRFGARTLRKAPVFTAVASITLALGIGANTAIFSAVNAIMLRRLPVTRPEELLSLAAVYPGGVEPVFSYAAYRRIASEGKSWIDPIAASVVRRDAATLDGPPEPVDLQWVSGNYFTTLGVAASRGRTLVDADDRPAPGEAVAVLSHRYWTRRFGGDPMAVGRSFRLKARTFTIVGVASREFTGDSAGESVDFWLPLSSQPSAPAWLWSGHSTTWLQIVGRRRPGVMVAQARAGLETVYGRIKDEVAAGTDSAEFRASTLASRLAVSDGSRGASRLRENLSAPLLLLMGLAGLVLLVTCANVANLMLARAAARRHETAVCLAIGAGRMRLVRQRCAEALLLASLGGLAGLLLARWGGSVLESFVTAALPIALDVRPDAPVLVFAGLVTGATVLLFGLLPALRATRVDPAGALRSAGGPARGRTSVPLGRTLVVTQIVVSLVLLTAAGLFVRSLLNLRRIEPGFDPDGVLLFRIAPPSGEQPLSADVRRGLYRELVRRAEAVPGVVGASASFSAVLSRGTWRNAVAIEGFDPPAGVTPRTLANAISPRYFDVLRIAVPRGRGFTDADGDTAPAVAVVNQTFSRQFLGGAEAVGKRIALCTSEACRLPPTGTLEIVGVAEDAKYTDLREEGRPMVYVPFTQRDQALSELQVRTAADPAGLAAATHRALAAVDPRVAVVAMVGAREWVDASLVAERLIARLSAAFGLLALALAGVGLHGLIAYVTAQRAAEIGVRMALGADRHQVRRLVLGGTLRLVVAGISIGLPFSLAGGLWLSSQLYEVAPFDPVAVSLGLLTICGVAVVASWLPAARAARVDPCATLRAQ